MVKSAVILLVFFLSTCSKGNKSGQELIKDENIIKNSVSSITSPNLLDFFSDFYFEVPESPTLVEQLKTVNDNPNLSKAEIDEDENLYAKIYDHPYLNLQGSNANLLAYGEYDSFSEKTGYSIFQIQISEEKNLNNVRVFQKLLQSFPVSFTEQFSENHKLIPIWCELCKNKNLTYQALMGQIDIYLSQGDNYVRDEMLPNQTYRVKLILNFDHENTHKRYDIK